MQLAPRPDSFHFVRAAPVLLVCRFRLPPLLARCLAGLPAFDFQTEPLVMVVAGIGGKPLFAASAFPLMAFHMKHHRKPLCCHNKKLHAIIHRGKIRNQDAGWILHPHVERASCLHYMARSRRQGCAPCTRRLHLDRVRSAIGWHLGITLGVCMSGGRTFAVND
jgi:hypothetical protein